MPELPEVEVCARAVADALIGSPIRTVKVLDDPIVFDEQSSKQVAAALRGRTVEAVERRGKYMWCRLDRGPHPVIHLGMTGGLIVNDVSPLHLHAHGQTDPVEWGQRFARLSIRSESGATVIYADPRRFGRIRLRDEPAEEKPIGNLGPDLLTDPPTARALHAVLERRRAAIKSVLLDQKVLAGVGNWIADEGLYQARIDPHRIAAELDLETVTRLRRALVRIVRRAVDSGARYDKFPRGWLFHNRWGKRAGRCGSHEIQFDTIGGRTTAWVPAVQG